MGILSAALAPLTTAAVVDDSIAGCFLWCKVSLDVDAPVSVEDGVDETAGAFFSSVVPPTAVVA